MIAEVRVRAAGRTDAERCVELLSAAREELMSTRGGDLLATLGTGVSPSDDEQRLLDAPVLVGAWMNDRDCAVFVADHRGTVDGFAVGRVVGPVPEGGSRLLGRVECCYVEAAARRAGLGTALLRCTVDWLKGRTCTDVDALAVPGDRLTKQLLEGGGMKARLLVLHRHLP